MGKCAEGGLRALLLCTATAGCVSEHDAVVRTAAGADVPWTCPGEATQVEQTSVGRYRLVGCGHAALYACNFTFQPPRCWVPDWGR